MVRALLLALCSITLLVTTVVPADAQECVSGTVVATYDADPAFPKLWRYCVTVQWNLGAHALSHLDVFLHLPDCECICDPRFVRFKPIAGSSVSTDVEPPCETTFYGEYVCYRDPSIPAEFDGSVVKFEPNPSACEPGVTGYGTFCFFTPMPPQPASTYPQDLAIKHGQETCYGPLTGQLPSCNCLLPTRPSTWGSVKAIYR